jgi:hypothetical protein
LTAVVCIFQKKKKSISSYISIKKKVHFNLFPTNLKHRGGQEYEFPERHGAKSMRGTGVGYGRYSKN